MEKPDIVFRILIDDKYEAGLVKKALQSIDYEASFLEETKETLQISENDLDILLLKPSMAHWAWLEVVIKMKEQHPSLPIILYSPDLGIENDFQTLPDDDLVFLVGGVGVLKDKLNDIVKTIIRGKLGDIVETMISEKQAPEKAVLFVDDDKNILDSYTRILRKTPWKVITTTSAEDALEILQKEKVDLVVTDIKMPQVHGIELISRIREKHKEVPIVICSGYQGMREDQSIRFHKIADFIEKPVDSEILKQKIEKILQLGMSSLTN